MLIITSIKFRPIFRSLSHAFAPISRDGAWLCTCSSSLVVWFRCADVLADAGARPPRRTVGRTLNLLSLFAASAPAAALDGFDDTRSDYGDDDGRNFYQSFDDASLSSSSSSSSAALLRAPGISIVEHCAWDASAQVNALCIENKVAVIAASTGQLVALLEGHSARVTACEFGIHAPASLVTVSGAAMGMGVMHGWWLHFLSACHRLCCGLPLVPSNINSTRS